MVCRKGPSRKGVEIERIEKGKRAFPSTAAALWTAPSQFPVDRDSALQNLDVQTILVDELLPVDVDASVAGVVQHDLLRLRRAFGQMSNFVVCSD